LLWQRLLDMERTWKPGPGAGFVLHCTCAVLKLVRCNGSDRLLLSLSQCVLQCLFAFRRDAAHLVLHVTGSGQALFERQGRLHVIPGSGCRVDVLLPEATLPTLWVSDSMWSSESVILAEWSVYPVGAIPRRRQLVFAWSSLFGLLSLEETAARKHPNLTHCRRAGICSSSAAFIGHQRACYV
jgi:hypothetical protein